MRNLLRAMVVVALVAAPGMAATDVQVIVDNANISIGGTAHVTVQVKAPAGLGVASLAGSVTASGTGGLSASGFNFALAYDRTTAGVTDKPEVLGAIGTNGGWANFGSMQIPYNDGSGWTDLPIQTTAAYGNGVWADFCSYTVTGTSAGNVTLHFVPGAIGGFLPVTTDKDETMGNVTDVTIAIGNGPTPPVIVSLTPSPVTGSAPRANSFYMNVSPATNDLTLTAVVTPGTVPSPTYQWTKVSGTIPVVSGTAYGTNPCNVSFESPNAATTRVRFSRNGTYVLQLAVNDGVNPPVTAQVTIRVTSADFDNIGATVNAADRTKFVNAFGNMTNEWADFDGVGSTVNAADRTKFVNAFGFGYTITAYPAEAFH